MLKEYQPELKNTNRSRAKVCVVPSMISHVFYYAAFLSWSILLGYYVCPTTIAASYAYIIPIYSSDIILSYCLSYGFWRTPSNLFFRCDCSCVTLFFLLYSFLLLTCTTYIFTVAIHIFRFKLCTCGVHAILGCDVYSLGVMFLEMYQPGCPLYVSLLS